MAKNKEAAPNTKEETATPTTVPTTGIMTRGSNTYRVDPTTQPGAKLKDLIKSGTIYRYDVDKLSVRKDGVEEDDDIFSTASYGDANKVSANDVTLYCVYKSGDMEVWMDESSNLTLDEKHYARFSVSNVTPRLLIVDSKVEIGSLGCGDRINEDTSLVVSVAGKIGSLRNSMVAYNGQYASRTTVQIATLHESTVITQDNRINTSSITKSNIHDSLIDLPGAIGEAHINKCHLRAREYSSINNTELLQCSFNVKSLRIGIYGDRYNRPTFRNVEVYAYDRTVGVRRPFEIGIAGDGMRRHSLVYFVTDQYNEYGNVKMHVYSPNTGDYDHECTSTDISSDMTRSEIHKLVSALLFPKRKADGLTNAIGPLEDVIIAESVNVLIGRMDIIKQVRLADSI